MDAVTIAVKVAELIFTGAGEKIGGDLWTKIITTIRDKFAKEGTEFLLTRAKNKPTEPNVQMLEGELIMQMNEDKDFEKKVRELVEQIKKEEGIPPSSGKTNIQNGGQDSTNIQFNDKVYYPSNFGNKTTNTNQPKEVEKPSESESKKEQSMTKKM